MCVYIYLYNVEYCGTLYFHEKRTNWKYGWMNERKTHQKKMWNILIKRLTAFNLLDIFLFFSWIRNTTHSEYYIFIFPVDHARSLRTLDKQYSSLPATGIFIVKYFRIKNVMQKNNKTKIRKKKLKTIYPPPQPPPRCRQISELVLILYSSGGHILTLKNV